MITQQRLIELYFYDKETGLLIKRRNGKVQTKGDALGNIRIRIDGKTYLAQQMALLYVSGTIPKGHIIHKDGDRKNNKFENLLTGPEAKQLNTIRRNEKAMSNRLAGYDPDDKFTHRLKALFDKNWRVHGRHLRRTEGPTVVYLLEYERYINNQLGRN